MNLIFVICISVFIVCLFLFLLLSKKGTTYIKNGKIIDYDSSKIQIRNPNISSLKIPKKIIEMDFFLLQKDCKNLFDNFKALSYNKKDKIDLSLVEWNNWEILLLMGLIKADKDIFISNPQEVFHSSIVELSKAKLTTEINKIFEKSNKIDNNLPNDILKNQINWSIKEISIVFYYLSRYKFF